MNPGWIMAALGLASAVCALLAWAGRHAWRAVRRVGHFLDDYHGQAAHDGLAGQPGFMARLGSVETVVQQVLAETRPNHGESLRDEVRLTRVEVGEIRRRMELFESQRAGREDGP